MRPDDGRVVSNFIVQALRGNPLTIYGDGTQTRSFSYVSDTVDGVYRLLMVSDSGASGLGEGSDVDVHLPFNIGNPLEFTVTELARLILEITGKGGEIAYKPLPVDDPRVRQPNITRALKILGWKPEVDLRTGLKNTVDFFRIYD
jgi:nucleoside-diphosphate-sugar epimerase